jgi:hypothetical protein
MAKRHTDTLKIDSLEVVWTSREIENFAVDKINRQMTIKQSDAAKLSLN